MASSILLSACQAGTPGVSYASRSAPDFPWPPNSQKTGAPQPDLMIRA